MSILLPTYVVPAITIIPAPGAAFTMRLEVRNVLAEELASGARKTSKITLAES